MGNSVRRKNLERLLRPRSVAIVGASGDPGRIGGRPVRYLREAGFNGQVYPINAKYEEIQGLKCFPSIDAIEVPVDAVIVSVRAELAVAAIDECSRCGVGGVVLFSSDFAETGAEGVRRQQELTRIANETGLRILGPNCLGAFDADNASFLTFSSFFDRGIPRGGRTALISQSGGYGSHLLEVVKDRGVRVGTWITTGNEADVEIGECIEWAASQPGIDKILAYAEGVKDGGSFRRGLEAARAAGKPVIFMKSGRSERGTVAATTHTAALAGSDAMYDGIFEQFGVRRVYNGVQMADVAYMLDGRAMPGNRSTALFTVSGAGGVQMADAAEDAGVAIPAIPPEVQAKIHAFAPFASPLNPVDFTAQALNDPSLVTRCLSTVIDGVDVGCVVIYLTMTADDPGLRDRLLDELSAFAGRHDDKLFVICMLGSAELVAAYERAGFRVFEDSALAMSALGLALRDTSTTDAEVASPALVTPGDICEAARSEAAGKALLNRLGLRAPRGELVEDPVAARLAAEAIGFPVVVKIASEKIVHKSDVGGVRIGLQTPDDVEDAARAIIASARSALPDIGDTRLLVEEQVSASGEMILGIECDPVLGPMVMAGFGGVTAEIYRDVAFRMAPVGEAEALRMLSGLKGKAFFEAFRGRGRLDMRALSKAISTLSAFAAAHAQEIASFDINPLLVQTEAVGKGTGVIAADCVIALRRQERGIAGVANTPSGRKR